MIQLLILINVAVFVAEIFAGDELLRTALAARHINGWHARRVHAVATVDIRLPARKWRPSGAQHVWPLYVRARRGAHHRYSSFLLALSIQHLERGVRANRLYSLGCPARSPSPWRFRWGVWFASRLRRLVS